VRDGIVHTYRLRIGGGNLMGPWRQLVVGFVTDGAPGSIELLSVSVVPAGATYAEAPHGVRPVTVGERIRRTLYTHAPGSIAYRVRVPEGGRLDAALGRLGGGEDSVTFRVGVRSGGEEETLFEERYADSEQWAQRSVDLSEFAGKTVTLTLETSAEQPGTVAFWGAPTVSGARTSERPTVIFYVIDGGGADQMSLYGYNRRTTPNLERLASEGALFEHAYSNSSWTKPSTASFMTSLHSSVLGNVERFDPLPPEARTMAERFHAAGYPTAVFTSNPNAGSVSGLERSVDTFRDEGCCNRGPGNGKSVSSVELHRDFWEWRETAPSEPFWVHFQTTDVHSPHRPAAPFAGLFAPGGEAQLARWDSTLRTEPDWQRTRWAETGIDRIQYWDAQRSVFDETMAHQDYQLGRFVERLRESGQWENTLLIVAADHSIWAGSHDFLTYMQDSLPPDWQMPILRSSISRVPLMFIWPGHIARGQRFREPVSMIDVLPTVLELVGLPAPEVLQGQSLAPLLLGRAGWQSRPVIFDQFENDPRTGELYGRIEMVDGRWGASLWIGPPRDTLYHRPTPLLLFDVWNDPLALRPVNDEHPALVLRYTELLQRQWEAHRLLARRFTPGGELELTAAQLETLRALGYIR
jgi:arylsulfatase A-like enzyme